MRLKYKAALLIFTIGALLLLVYTAIYNSNIRAGEIKSLKRSLEKHSIVSGENVWHSIEAESHKASTLLHAPMIIATLIQSNTDFETLPVEVRQKKIKELNSNWMEADDESDPFIQSYLTNSAALYLKKHIDRHSGEYGEIFLTNRYGVLIASTGKLTTLAHAHKYWWKASYASGKGRIFIDDRGYDKSIKGVVLGIVVPLKIDGEIIGIIKVNVNVSHGLQQTVVNEFHLGDSSAVRIIRSNGDVVLAKGKEPLSTKVSPALMEVLGKKVTSSIVVNEGGKEILYAYSPISFTVGLKDYLFGGKQESIDHIMGNTGEFWYVLISEDLSEALAPFHRRLAEIILMGALLTILMGITALFVGKWVSLPVIRMAEAAKRIGNGDFDVNIEITSNDELGELAKSFNKMAQVSNISINELKNEIAERKRAEKDLKDSMDWLNKAQEIAHLGNWDQDLTTDELWWSDEEYRIFGLSPHQFDPTFKKYLKMVRPNDRSMIIEKIALASGDEYHPFNLEYRLIRPDGSIRTVHEQAEVIRDDNGKAVRMVGTTLDITERKRAEEELTESVEKYRLLFSSMLNGAALHEIVVDKNNKPVDYIFLELNDTFETMTGLKRADLIGRKVTEVLPGIENDPSDWISVYGKVAQTGKEIRFEQYAEPLDKWYSVYAYRTSVNQFATIFEDITERKKVGEALKESEEKYRLIAHSIGDAIISADSEGRIVSWNRGARQIFGYEEEELLGKPLVWLIPERYRDAHRNGLNRFISTGEANFIGKTVELEGLRKDGNEFPLELSLSNWSSGKDMFFTAIIRDITERKKAEEALRKLNNAIEQTAEAVVITDVEGTVEYVNPGFEKITGYTKEEIIGRNPRVLKSGRHDGSFYKNLWDTIKSGNIWKGKIVNKRKTGELYEEEMTISPVLEDHGEITHFVAIKRDVSEQKRLQQQLIHAEKLSSVGTFVAGVAHELNNPLTTILGFSQELAKIKSLPIEITNDLNVIAQESRRTVGIVKNLLRFSRKYKPGKVMFDVNEVVDDTISLQAYRFKIENITIIKKCAQNLPAVHGDVNQIRQVFMNIILNARDAMLSANNGGTLKVKTETNGQEVKVIFENDGPPIPPENFNRIFDPFFTTKEVGVGTGLGLSISFGIIKEHDGTLWVDNLGDKGVKFTLTLPAVPEPLERTASNPGRIELPKNLHILLVEDESKIEEWLARILVNNGINVQTVSNGKAAIDYLVQNSDVDVILSDIKMPEMDGFELVNWINDNSKHHVNRVVLITGVTDQDVEDYCDRYGCRLLIKPFDETQVLEVISAVVKNSVSF